MLRREQVKRILRQMQEYRDSGGCAPATPRYSGPDSGLTVTITFSRVTDPDGSVCYRPVADDTSSVQPTQYFDRAEHDREVAKYNKAIERILVAIERQQEHDCLASLMVIQRLKHTLAEFRRYVYDITYS